MVFVYNCTRNDAAGFSPYELLFGRKPRLPIDINFGMTKTTVCTRYPAYLKDWRNAIEQAYKIAAEKSGQCMKRGREAYNRNCWMDRRPPTRRASDPQAPPPPQPEVKISKERTNAILNTENPFTQNPNTQDLPPQRRAPAEAWLLHNRQ